MRLSNRYRQHLIAASIVAVCLIWAAVYVYHTANDPFGGDESALFIQPLFYLLLMVAAVCAVSEVGVILLASEQPSSDDHALFGASGLADGRRLLVVLSLPLMVMLIWFFGFVIASAAYVTSLTWGLGERRETVLIAMALIAMSVVWLLFSKLLGASLPLWPAWFR